MEMSFLPNSAMIFSASAGAGPHLFIADREGHVRLLLAEEARYPAVSPDGRWLALSRLQRGTWNLWMRDLQTGKMQSITSAACNNIAPAWEADSKTLLYVSDCGRGLWLTALCRRRVVP
jgi:Tol biopolymer transport system component